MRPCRRRRRRRSRSRDGGGRRLPAQVLEHERVDLAGHLALLEVLGADPAGEGLLETELRLVPERSEPRLDLASELPLEVEQRAGLRPAEVEVMKADESRELRD